MSAKFTLPDLPHPDFLRKRAKARLAELKLRLPSARLAHVQLVMAREYGFASWASLQAEVARRHDSPRGQWGRIRRSPVATMPPAEACADSGADPLFLHASLHAGAAMQIGFVLAALVGVALVLLAGSGVLGAAFPAHR